MEDVRLPAGVGRKIQQKRGQRTYNALITTGFKLLDNSEFESISVANLARAAGYSVGAFYSRFHSKDEFFDALVARHLEERKRMREHLLGTSPKHELVRDLIDDLVTCYWKRRRFWRAALMRSTGDPAFWQPISRHARESLDALVARVQSDARRRLTKTECMNIRFAYQLALGTINNKIVNRPLPSFIGQSEFVRNLVRAFRLVSGYDDIIGRRDE